MQNTLTEIIGNYTAEQPIKTKVRIYFDGGTRPTNPGNGYGSYEVECGSVPQFNHKGLRQEFGANCTSNQAEYLSLVAALKWLRHKTNGKGVELTIMSDSKIVVMQVQGSWKCKNAVLSEFAKLVNLMLSDYSEWSINWRPRKFNVERFGH